jgi:hypothetical protein
MILGHDDPAEVLWQGDHRWRSMLVGMSPTKRCGAVGCVLTAVAMARRILGLDAGATPASVQGRGLRHTPRVWAPSSAAAVIPHLAAANGLTCAASPVLGSAQDMRAAILDALTPGPDGRAGVALLHVDTDTTDDDDAGKHWVLAHRAYLRDGKRTDGVVHYCDPATAGGRRAPSGAPAGLDGLDLRTLSGIAMWGSTPRAYAVRAVRPLRRA